MNVTGERLREIMEEVGVSQEDLADAVGVTQGAISQILLGKTQRSRYLPAIAENLGVQLSWLTGKSSDKWLREMQPDNDPQRAAEQIGSVLVPQLELGYSMGGGAVFSDYEHVGAVPFARDWLRRKMKGSFGDLFVAEGRGDSMQPTMLNGDTVLIDTAQKNIREQDLIWALSYGDLGMIKRVRRLPSGGFLVLSDNQAVAPFEAHDGEMHVVGRVIWIGRWL